MEIWQRHMLNKNNSPFQSKLAEMHLSLCFFLIEKNEADKKMKKENYYFLFETIIIDQMEAFFFFWIRRIVVKLIHTEYVLFENFPPAHRRA